MSATAWLAGLVARWLGGAVLFIGLVLVAAHLPLLVLVLSGQLLPGQPAGPLESVSGPGQLAGLSAAGALLFHIGYRLRRSGKAALREEPDNK